MSPSKATLAGFVAILLWSALAVLTSMAPTVPPFQLLALCFAIGGGAGMILTWARGGRGHWPRTWPVWGLGVGGLFGYHMLYVLALRRAGAVEGSLIAYLWPLLIVLFSTRVTGEPLRWHHILGALLAALGAGLVVTGGGATSFRLEHALGYAIALAAAVTWASYSVLSRRFRDVPAEAVTGFCLATALLSALLHMATEDWVPPDRTAWLAILGLGLGPVGLAFFLWDSAMKHGDMPVLGAASYGAPLLSTLILVTAGTAKASWSLALACVLITGGALLAARTLLSGRG